MDIAVWQIYISTLFLFGKPWSNWPIYLGKDIIKLITNNQFIITNEFYNF